MAPRFHVETTNASVFCCAPLVVCVYVLYAVGLSPYVASTRSPSTTTCVGAHFMSDDAASVFDR